MPVFTTAERAANFVLAKFTRPETHMQMLESIGLTHAPPLTGGRFVIMPVSAQLAARTALEIEADYAIRDPRPGDQQEVIRLT